MNDTIEILRGANLQSAQRPIDWIWDGLVGPGQLALFTSVPKMGKTTLLAHFLICRKAGGELIGQAVRAGASVVVSEEVNALWQERSQRLGGFRGDDCFICRPFAMAPSPERWQQLIGAILKLHTSDGVDLAVVDPLAHFLPLGAENVPGLLMESLLPLRRLTDAGMAVVLVHHPRKASSQAGVASRGSSVLPAFADIIMEMYPAAPSQPRDRHRRLLSFSRHPATPRVVHFELSEDGRSFVKNPEPPPEDEFAENWRVLSMVFEDADRELTRQEILEQWPSTYPAPKSNTLWRWLSTAVERGLVRAEGNGRRADPYRYYLPGKLEAWKEDPMYELHRAMEEGAKRVRQLGRSAG